MPKSLQEQHQDLLHCLEQVLIILSKSSESFSKDDLLLKIDKARKLLARALEIDSEGDTE